MFLDFIGIYSGCRIAYHTKSWSRWRRSWVFSSQLCFKHVYSPGYETISVSVFKGFFFLQKLLIQKLQILLEFSIMLEQSRTALGCDHTKWHTWPSGLGWQMWRQALGRTFFSGTTFIVIIFSYPGLTNIFGTYRARWTSVVRNDTRVFLFF